MEGLLFFFFLAYLEGLSLAQQASIVVSPISVNITVNATANFTCTAVAEDIEWEVNGLPVDSDLRSRGFNDEAVPLTLLNATQNLHTKTMSVFGSPDNNGSSIICVALFLPPSFMFSLNKSEPAVLLVFDEPPGKPQQQQQICTARDDMIIYPFPLMSSFNSSYTYHGSCEHTLLTSCGLMDTFAINVDFSAADLSLGRVGVRIGSMQNVVVLENMTVDAEGFGDPARIADGVEVLNKSVIVSVTSSNVSINITELGIIVTVIDDTVNQTKSVVIDLTEYNTSKGAVCGLCGSQDGELVYSDAVTIVEQRTRENLQEFAQSWLVNPGEQILRQQTRDCGVLANDTVIGEALFTVPLLTNSSLSQSLCYEIYGSAGTIFNLISDRCVSVNAHYTAMSTVPENGTTIITSVGIMAVDNAGQCIGVTIAAANQCMPVIAMGSATQMLTGTYSRQGVTVRRSLQRVRVSVPNCENVQLVMWAICEGEGAQQQIRVMITRGLNLRPTSHGLIGQFWNTPATVQPHHVQLSPELTKYFILSNLFLVSISQRQFIAERFHRSWDLSPQTCLYAGSSQGGALSDIPGPRDSVIEGRYTQYIVSGLLETNYTFTQFDRSFCSK